MAESLRVKRWDYWLMKQRHRILAYLKTVGQGHTYPCVETRGNTKHAEGPKRARAM